jgi:hypothetical protein
MARLIDPEAALVDRVQLLDQMIAPRQQLASVDQTVVRLGNQRAILLAHEPQPVRERAMGADPPLEPEHRIQREADQRRRGRNRSSSGVEPAPAPSGSQPRRRSPPPAGSRSPSGPQRRTWRTGLRHAHGSCNSARRVHNRDGRGRSPSARTSQPPDCWGAIARGDCKPDATSMADGCRSEWSSEFQPRGSWPSAGAINDSAFRTRVTNLVILGDAIT